MRRRLAAASLVGAIATAPVGEQRTRWRLEISSTMRTWLPLNV
jgi:hypothetical protein